MIAIGLFAIGFALLPADPIVLPRPSAIDGVVVDAEGKPAPEAEIFLFGMVRGGGITSVWKGHPDADGRFRADMGALPATSPSWLNWTVNLFAYDRARGMARASVNVHTPPEWPVRLALRPPDRVRIRVVGPDGKGIVGAKLKVMAFGRELPPELEEGLPVVTDPEGRATLAGFPAPETRTVVVEAKGFGTQSFWRSGADDAEATLALGPVGRLAGRVVADDPARARGVRVTGTTSPARPDDGTSRPSGRFRAVTDAEGRFEVGEVVAGSLFISALPTAFDVVPMPVQGKSVEAGGRTEVELVLKRGIPVRGVVREQGTGRPIAGASLLLGSRPDGGTAPALSDASGRFETFLRPGQVEVSVISGSPYVLPDGPRSVLFRALHLATLPENSAGLDLPPIELIRGIDVRGTVRDEAGKLAAEAEVDAVSADGRVVIGGYSLNPGPRTNDRGEFVLKAMTPGVRLELSAQRGESSTGTPVTVVPESGVAVELVIRPENTMSLGGRVVDERGRPIVGAEVAIRARSKTQATAGTSRGPSASGDWSLRTDDDGRFRTPHLLRRHEEHQAMARGAGRGWYATNWFAPTTPSFFDLTLFPSYPPDERSIRAKYDAGKAALGRGEYAKAEAEFDAAIEEAEQKKAGTPLDVGYWLLGQAEPRLVLGKHAEAEALARRALSLFERELGDGHESVADSLTSAAVASEHLGKVDEAEMLFRKALAIREKAQGVEHPRYGFGLRKLGVFLAEQGRYAEAEVPLGRAVVILEKTLGVDHRELIDPLDARGYALLKLKRYDEAEAILRRLLPLAERILGRDHHTVGGIRSRLTWLLRNTGRLDEANAIEAMARRGPGQIQ